MNVLDNVDLVPSNVRFSHQEALLYVLEDNEAVIKMIKKGRSPTMRHVSRTHRVALDWLFDRINLDPKIQIQHIDTKNQLADIQTKGNFTRDEWNHLLCLFNISHFSSTACTAAMAKRTQQDSGEERVTAKSRPMMNLIARAPSTLSSSASEGPGKKSFESQSLLSAQAEKYDRTVKPVVCPDTCHERHRPVEKAHSSSYSEWNVDQTLSCQEWKSDELMEDRKGRPVGGQQFTQDTDKFVIDDDDMDSDTATESNFSLRSRSFLNRVNDRLRKILDQSSKYAMQDIAKRSLIWWMFTSSTFEASVLMGRGYSENFAVHQKYTEQSHNETRCSTYLKSW